MEFPMAMQMKDSNSSIHTSLTTAVRNSLRPACLIPLTAAVFFSSYSYALGLQEIQINSNLGEPLNATILLTNPPARAITSDCFTVLKNPANSSFPNISTATAQLSKVSNGYAINISSKELIKEPISTITVASSCSSLPIIERTYTVMIDPAGVSEERIAKGIFTPRNNTRIVTDLNANRILTQNRSNTSSRQTSIAQNSSYQVKRGDSLSSIAARIQNIPDNSVWSVAASILATNPSAFINNNPDYIIQGNTLNIPSFTADFIPNEASALRSIKNNTLGGILTSQNTPKGVVSNLAAVTQTQASPRATRYTVAQETNQALSTMTLSTSLSAVSLERIEARRNGLAISDSLLPNTSSLFGTGEDESPSTPQQSAAISPKQTVEPKDIYVDRPAYPTEIEQRINAGINEGVTKFKSENTSSSSKLAASLLATLIGLGLLSWFVVRPFIKRRNRLAFIRTVRLHKKKSKYIARNKQRKNALHRLPAKKTSVLSNKISEITNTVSKSVPEIHNEKTELELQQHADAIEAAFTSSNKAVSPDKASNKSDKQVVVNSNNGPRDTNIAKEVYEVNTIDDTGELASLTMAFPELEAELNARLGGKAPNLGKDIVEQNAETMTVQFESPLEDVLDFELPGLIDNLEGDFESVVKEGDFASTMVFNEEIFSNDNSINPFDEDSKTSQTLSTEAIDTEDETRIAEIMVDADGLKPSDFGLDDDDFPTDKENYSYLEPDASINSPGINLSSEELEELGLNDDDDNIVPFSKRSQTKKS